MLDGGDRERQQVDRSSETALSTLELEFNDN